MDSSSFVPGAKTRRSGIRVERPQSKVIFSSRMNNETSHQSMPSTWPMMGASAERGSSTTVQSASLVNQGQAPKFLHPLGFDARTFSDTPCERRATSGTGVSVGHSRGISCHPSSSSPAPLQLLSIGPFRNLSRRCLKIGEGPSLLLR